MVLLLKVTVILPLVVVLGTMSLLRLKEEGWRAETHRAVAFAAGFLAPVVIAGVALAVSGAGSAYLEIQRDFVAGYVRLSPSDTGSAEQGWRYFWRLYWVPAVVAAAGLVRWSVQACRRAGVWEEAGEEQNAVLFLLGVWLVAALASVALQGKYFGYHWTPVLLPLAGLAGHGLAWLLSPVGRWEKRSAGTVLLAGALLITGWSVERSATGYGATLQLAMGRLQLTEYWSRFGRPYGGDFSFAADRWAARYIQRQTRPDDPVFLWGFEPLTLFLAGRRAPTRFVFAVPLVSPWTPAGWREELMRDLKRRPPVLFGVMRRDAVPHASGRRDDSAAQLEGFPALRDFLKQHYRYERTIEDLTLYRWNRATGDGRR